MADELSALGRSIGEHLGRIADRASMVVQAYHKRITDRVQALVADQGVTVEPEDLIREVAILADRCDISEEIVRLRAHLAQYAAIIDEPESSRPEAGVPGAGDGAGDQHDRLEGQRRGDQPRGGGRQGPPGKDPRAGSKCGMMGGMRQNRVVGTGRDLPAGWS